jgi:flagellar protein FlaG
MNIETVNTVAKAVQETAAGQRASSATPQRVVEQPGTPPAVDTSRTRSAPLTREAVQQALNEAQQQLSTRGVTLKFNLIDNSKDVQVEVVDSANQKVIRKIPADEAVKLSASIRNMAGVFMNKQS